MLLSSALPLGLMDTGTLISSILYISYGKRKKIYSVLGMVFVADLGICGLVNHTPKWRKRTESNYNTTRLVIRRIFHFHFQDEFLALYLSILVSYHPHISGTRGTSAHTGTV